MAFKLLLADDSVTIRRLVELTFADEDVEVTAVGDGQEAIARLEADPPDIVLADVGTPGRNGYDVAAHIKHRPHLAHIPVLLLCGAFERVDTARAQALGCEGVLPKPLEPDVVVARVKELLGIERRGAASQSPGTRGSMPASAPEGRSGGPVEQAEPRAGPPVPLPDRAEEPTSVSGLSFEDYLDRLDALDSDVETPVAERGPVRRVPPPDLKPHEPVRKATRRQDDLRPAWDRSFADLEDFPRETLAKTGVPREPPDDMEALSPPRSTVPPSGLPTPVATDETSQLPTYELPAISREWVPREAPDTSQTPQATDRRDEHRAILPSAPPVAATATHEGPRTRAIEDEGASEAPESRPATEAASGRRGSPLSAVARAFSALLDQKLGERSVASAPAAPSTETAATVSESSPSPAPPVPSAPLISAAPPLSAEFAAAVEQPAPATSSSTDARFAPAAPFGSDTMVDQITREVLARLSPQTIREAVGDIVSEVAERVIREEIERLKRSLA